MTFTRLHKATFTQGIVEFICNSNNGLVSIRKPSNTFLQKVLDANVEKVAAFLDLSQSLVIL